MAARLQVHADDVRRQLESLAARLQVHADDVRRQLESLAARIEAYMEGSEASMMAKRESLMMAERTAAAQAAQIGCLEYELRQVRHRRLAATDSRWLPLWDARVLS